MLARWTTTHVPRVLGVEESVGALLLEAIEPGPPLSETPGYPSTARVAALITSLQRGALDPSYPSLADRIAYLFDSGMKPYERTPEVVDTVPTSSTSGDGASHSGWPQTALRGSCCTVT